MSTKTSIKRIALVAAAALTLGGFSVITASTANAAAVAATGISVSVAAPAVAADFASTTPGTSGSPIAVTVAPNSQFYVAVATAGTATADTFTAYSDSAFSNRIAAYETHTNSAAVSTFGWKDQITAPGVPGTYYYKFATGASSDAAAYLAVTVSPISATVYDGSTSGNLGSLAPSGVAGAANTVTLKVGQDLVKRGSITVSGAGATIAQVGNTVQLAGTVSTVVATGTDSSTSTTMVINTPSVGTVTVSYYAETGASTGLYSTTPTTVTITVAATGSAGVLSVTNSTFYDTITTGTAANLAGTMTTAPNVAATAGAAAVVRFDFALADAVAAAMPSTTKYTVTMTGPGTLGTAVGPTNAGARALASAAASGTFYLFGDGTSGTTVVTLSVGTTVIGSYSAVFYSSTVASIAATLDYKYVNAASAADFTAPKGTGGTVDYVSVTAKDSSGNAIPSASLTAVSSNTAVLTVSNPIYDSTDKVYYVPVTGVSRGSATVTVKDSTGLILSTPVTLQVTKAVIEKFTLGTDAASYNAGDKVKVTITATDSNGDPVADGTYKKFIADTQTSSIPFGSGKLFDSAGNAPVFKAGLAYTTVYAPLFSGPITLTAYLGTSTTVLSAALQAVATAATAQTNSLTVATAGSSGGDAALAYDAASAATDAANNAYEEAQNATQAASDALAAVKALAVQVKALIALVNKIKAKIGA